MLLLSQDAECEALSYAIYGYLIRVQENQKLASEYKFFRLFHFDDLAFFWTAINMLLLQLDAEWGALSYAIYSLLFRV